MVSTMSGVNVSGVLLLLAILVSVSYGQLLYVTFHGGSGSGVNNIQSYTMSGRSVKSIVSNPSGLSELRGMNIFNGSLYFANADKDNSFVGVLNNVCGGSFSKAFSNGLLHPYGVAGIASSNRLYVSNQDNNAITVYSQGSNQVFATSSKSPRGVAVDQSTGYVYFSDEKSNKVEVYSNKGHQVSEIQISRPIGLHIDNTVTPAQLYIGSNGDNTKQIVAYTLSGGSPSPNGKFTHSGMGHPAGITTYNSRLYVLDQDNTSLIYFSIPTQQYLGTLASSLPDKPEQLLLVTQCGSS